MATIASARASSPAVLTSMPSPSLTSTTADTPTSSHRPSIDLNQPTSTSTTAAPNTNPQSQRRNRAALRDYYNLKSKPPGSGSASTSTPQLTRTSSVTSITSTSTTTTNATTTTHPSAAVAGPGSRAEPLLPPTLDAPTFNPETFVAGLLRTSSLRDILRAESQLVSEIRNLDGERKALVYDNYSKLIKAVGTIGEMQRGMREDGGNNNNGNSSNSGYGGGGSGGNVNVYGGKRDQNGANGPLDGIRGLEGKLDGLMGVFEGEKGREGGRGEEGGNGGRRVGEERARRKKVDKVRWVLEAERRLKALVAEGKRDEAEREWAKVKELLDRWSGVEGVAQVREACEKVMVEDEKESDDGHEPGQENGKSDDGDGDGD